jgi:acetyltransferase-like isoleucine patch superfamily enzyme
MRRIVFMAWYRLKIFLFRFIVGEAAIEIVLYHSWFPRFVLEIGGATIGQGTRVYRWLSVHESQGSFTNLVIGEHVHVGKFVLLDLTAPLTIGNRVGIGMFSKVLSHQNLGNASLSEVYPRTSGPTTIPDDVVMGASSILLYPTRLAPGTMIAAGAVVRGEYEKPCVLMGNPARVTTLLPQKT